MVSLVWMKFPFIDITPVTEIPTPKLPANRTDIGPEPYRSKIITCHICADIARLEGMDV